MASLATRPWSFPGYLLVPLADPVSCEPSALVIRQSYVRSPDPQLSDVGLRNENEYAVELLKSMPTKVAKGATQPSCPALEMAVSPGYVDGALG